MKLHYSATSPYVRKVVVVAAETGLSDRIEWVMPATAGAAAIATVNPLAKVPALITDHGDALYDSPVIFEYLDSLHDGEKIFPAGGDARWNALRLQALGDGVLDAGLLIVMEGRREIEVERSARFVDFQKRKIASALDALETEASGLGDGPDIGTITVGCALGYVDFRLGDLAWRSTWPALAAWFEGQTKRPAMAASAPKDPG
ncbi:MAG: glutathione S-transferase family protein [Alphaproteobacteria bacterium]